MVCAAFTDQGEVFVWGYGILGKGPKLSESSTPEMIPPTLFGRSDFSPSVCVRRIRCGLNHFAAVTGEKRQTDEGLLGDPSCSCSCSGLKPCRLRRSQQAHAAWLLFADRGELFVWGKNVRGCLGIGKRDDQFFPWRVRQHWTSQSVRTVLDVRVQPHLGPEEPAAAADVGTATLPVLKASLSLCFSVRWLFQGRCWTWPAVLTTWLHLRSPSCEERLDGGMEENTFLTLELARSQLRASCCQQGATALLSSPPHTLMSQTLWCNRNYSKRLFLFCFFFLHYLFFYKEDKMKESVGQKAKNDDALVNL